MHRKSSNEEDDDDETQTEEDSKSEEETEDEEVDWHKIIASNINKNKSSMEIHLQGEGTERNEDRSQDETNVQAENMVMKVVKSYDVSSPDSPHLSDM